MTCPCDGFCSALADSETIKTLCDGFTVEKETVTPTALLSWASQGCPLAEFLVRTCVMDIQDWSLVSTDCLKRVVKNALPFGA